MPANRYYVDAPLEGTVTLREGEHHHLTHVMRAAPGDTVELINGRGGLATASVAETSRREATLSIMEATQSPPEAHTLILAQAIPRSNRLAIILEKGTELGTTHFHLFPGDRSESTKFSRSRTQQILITATKQCGRLYLPTLSLHPPLSEWSPPDLPAFYGDPNAKAPFQPSGDLIFFIGPESGFSRGEVKRLEKLGARGVRLHPNILRTDTAAIVALTLAMNSLPANDLG